MSLDGKSLLSSRKRTRKQLEELPRLRILSGVKREWNCCSALALLLADESLSEFRVAKLKGTDRVRAVPKVPRILSGV